MTRDSGFSVADFATGLLDDPKVRRLVRTTRDEAVIARCLVAHEATLLASWRAGERITLDDAAPLYLTGLDDLAARLIEVELLDSDRRIPESAWLSWFGAAQKRRDDRKFEGTVGGLMKSLGMTREQAVAEARRRLGVGGPDPRLGGPEPSLTRSDRTVPAVPGVARDDAPQDDGTGTKEHDAVVAHLRDRGFGAPTGWARDVLRELVRGYGAKAIVSALDADTHSKTTDELVKAVAASVRVDRAAPGDDGPPVEPYDGPDCLVCREPIDSVPSNERAVAIIGGRRGEIHEACRAALEAPKAATA